VLYGDHVYTVERGVLACVRASTGEVVYRERLSGSAGVCYASPVAADGKVYIVTRSSGVYVVAAGAEFRELAANRFEDDTSVFNATPAITGSRLLLRSDRRLYCVGK
jgi:outer membrane protein assembly factor BamB